MAAPPLAGCLLRLAKGVPPHKTLLHDTSIGSALTGLDVPTLGHGPFKLGTPDVWGGVAVFRLLGTATRNQGYPEEGNDKERGFGVVGKCGQPAACYIDHRAVFPSSARWAYNMRRPQTNAACHPQAVVGSCAESSPRRRTRMLQKTNQVGPPPVRVAGPY